MNTYTFSRTGRRKIISQKESILCPWRDASACKQVPGRNFSRIRDI